LTRQARQLGNRGVYHIMLRGNERKNIFQDAEDKEHFIGSIEAKQQEEVFPVYAYCK
jgi:putative transposase